MNFKTVRIVLKIPEGLCSELARAQMKKHDPRMGEDRWERPQETILRLLSERVSSDDPVPEFDYFELYGLRDEPEQEPLIDVLFNAARKIIPGIRKRINTRKARRQKTPRNDEGTE